jgi:hypothetical protein
MAAQVVLNARSAASTASRGGLAIVAAACLALAGCSSSEPETTFTYDVEVPDADDPGTVPDGGSLPDPCSLLTPAAITATSGIEFADGYFNDDQSTDTQSICEWLPTDATFPLVQVYVSGGAGQISTQRATAESMMGAGVDVTVPGAQDAYAVAKGSILGMAVGDYFVQVSYMTTDGTDVLGITSALAAEAAASL